MKKKLPPIETFEVLLAKPARRSKKPAPCHRCGQQTTTAPCGSAFIHGRDIDGVVVCDDCRKLFVADRQAFFREWQKGRGEDMSRLNDLLYRIQRQPSVG